MPWPTWLAHEKSSRCPIRQPHSIPDPTPEPVRLFIAINLPDSEKTRLSAQLEKLARLDLPVRWVDADSLHITLKFFGEVTEDQLPALRGALAAGVDGVAPFDISVGGFGAFPSPARPRIFKVDVERKPELMQLHKQLEETTAALGFESEQRAYAPHITVGRARRQMDRITADIDYKTVLRVESADLMRSHLSPRGARYDVIDRMDLH